MSFDGVKCITGVTGNQLVEVTLFPGMCLFKFRTPERPNYLNKEILAECCQPVPVNIGHDFALNE
ncbi:MAG: hypothetical protein WCC78_16610 [Terriglobales bacterium]|jgi:hypothetical protein